MLRWIDEISGGQPIVQFLIFARNSANQHANKRPQTHSLTTSPVISKLTQLPRNRRFGSPDQTLPPHTIISIGHLQMVKTNIPLSWNYICYLWCSFCFFLQGLMFLEVRLREARWFPQWLGSGLLLIFISLWANRESSATVADPCFLGIFNALGTNQYATVSLVVALIFTAAAPVGELPWVGNALRRHLRVLKTRVLHAFCNPGHIRFFSFSVQRFF